MIKGTIKVTLEQVIEYKTYKNSIENVTKDMNIEEVMKSI